MTDLVVPQPGDPARPGNHPKENTVSDWPHTGPDEFRPVLVEALQDPEVREAYDAERTEQPNRLDWDEIPRMLHELCDGHPGYAAEVFKLGHSWFCKHCYVRRWTDAGRPFVATGR